MRQLAVLISGSGTNLQALIDACAAGDLPAQVAVVVSNRKAAYGMERAAKAGIPTCYVPRQGLERAEYDAGLAAVVNAYQPDLVVLAGWMHILTPAFLEKFPNRVINLHPALPGMFPGVEAIQRAYVAFQAGEITHSGCMVHYAVPEVDAGAVIGQEIVSMEAHETLEAFEARMHAAEHRLIVRATKIALERLP